MENKPYIKDDKYYSANGEMLAFKAEDGKWKKPDGSPWTATKGIQNPWLIGNDFSARKGDIDKSGRGRTSLVSLAKKWKEEGEEAEVSKKKLQEVFKYMLGESVRNVKKIAKNEDAPMAVVMMAQALLDDRNKAKNLFEQLSWLFGKAATEIEVTKKTVVSTPEKEAIEKFLKDKY